MFSPRLALDSTESMDESAVASRFELSYQPALDGIRGVAILAVMLFNSRLSWFRGGYLGVDLFFVLSGFLITSLLVEEYQRGSRISLKKFYYRRALRLLPALMAIILFVSVGAAILQPKENFIRAMKGILYALFYVANWAQIGPNAGGIGPMSHAWSLSVEEQFYILWPLVLFALLRSGLRKVWIGAILLVFIAASISWNAWLSNSGEHYGRMYLGSDTRANELLIGCLAALVIHWGLGRGVERIRPAIRATSLITIGAILYAICTLPVYSVFLYRGGFALVALGTAVLLIDTVVFRSLLSKTFEWAPLVWVGKVSYGLYLWHFPIFEGFRQVLEGRMNPLVYDVARFGSVFIAAAASYYFLEKPFLRLKQRFVLTQPRKAGLSSPVLVSSNP